MNISLNTSNPLSPLLSAWERNQPSSSAAAAASAVTESGDTVNLRPQARLLEDSEVDSVLQSTQAMIGSDIFGAMSVHSGLDASRVAALLA